MNGPSSRRGKRIGMLAVARMVLRSIHKMLVAKVRFNPGKAA